jgi:GYF domain 2
MEPEYYYSQAGQRLGPVPGEQLKQLAASGHLQPTDLIWKEGMSGWVAAAKVKGLFPAPPEPARATDPPPATAPPNWQPEAAEPASGTAADAARTQARQAKEAAMAAGGHAWKAFQVLIRNPVGGLRETFDLLGPTPALGVGIVFAAICVLCDLAASWIAHGIPGVSLLIREVVFVLVPIGVTVGMCFLAQVMFRGAGGIQAAIFVAGAALLPLYAGGLLLLVLASTHVIVNISIAILALTTTTLMTNSGCTTVLRVPDIAATFVVPVIFILDIVAFKLLLASELGPGFSM